jgi:nucleoside-diphosphate-sugar epimerase
MGLPSRRIDFDARHRQEFEHNTSIILYTVPPPSHGKADPRLQYFLAQLDPHQVHKFVLISTTGVYGDCAGKWIDETAPLQPNADRAIRRVDAESCLQKWAYATSVDTIILRVPGIYAPDRLPLNRLKRADPVVRRKQAPWTNRIHADDLANICYAALQSSLGNEIINVADDSPSTMTDYLRAVANYAGLPHPPEISLEQANQEMSAGMISYLAESRRIENQKMKSLLNIKLLYPSLAKGLATS